MVFVFVIIVFAFVPFVVVDGATTSHALRKRIPQPVEQRIADEEQAG